MEPPINVHRVNDDEGKTGLKALNRNFITQANAQYKTKKQHPSMQQKKINKMMENSNVVGFYPPQPVNKFSPSNKICVAVEKTEISSCCSC